MRRAKATANAKVAKDAKLRKGRTDADSCEMENRELLLDGLGDDADVGDAGLFDGVHDGGEGAKGDLLVGADVDDFFLVLGR